MIAAREKSPPLQTSLTTLSFCYSLPVKLKWNLIQQNWSVMIQGTDHLLRPKGGGVNFGGSGLKMYQVWGGSKS